MYIPSTLYIIWNTKKTCSWYCRANCNNCPGSVLALPSLSHSPIIGTYSYKGRKNISYKNKHRWRNGAVCLSTCNIQHPMQVNILWQHSLIRTVSPVWCTVCAFSSMVSLTSSSIFRALARLFHCITVYNNYHHPYMGSTTVLPDTVYVYMYKKQL